MDRRLKLNKVLSTKPNTNDFDAWDEEKIPGHKQDEAWQYIWRALHGVTGRRDEAAMLRPLLGMLQDALEFRRVRRQGGLPAGDATNVVSEERRPVVKEVARQHPVHDLSWYSFNEKRLWIPWAIDVLSGQKRGTYPNKYPRGMVLHWTAGHRNGLTEGNVLMRATGMLYLVGDQYGALAQSDPLSHWGYHAGASAYPGLNGTVSDELVGLELQCWGKVSRNRAGNFVSWSGAFVDPSEVVSVNRRANIVAGYYQRLTEAQVNLARRTACWLHLNYPAVFSLDRVLGHDEVSPGRKADPGGSIVYEGKSLTMPEFRELIKEDVGRIQSARRKK